jgi:DNA-binding response OmpR family regulator
LQDSPYSAEDLLKELEVSKEMIEEIRKSDSDNKLIFILNDEINLIGLNNRLSFDVKKSGNLEYKIFNINLDQEEVYINNKRVKLTTLEYKLLLFFLYNAKKLISKQEIIDYLWDKGSKDLCLVNLYTHIKNLKKKLIKSGVGNFIHSIYGQGYKFEDPEEIIL